MKNLSIRWKITLWFSIAMVIIVLLTLVMMILISDSVAKKNIKNSLIAQINLNSSKIEFSHDLENDEEIYINFGNGYLEIESDFLDNVNGIYTALYDSTGDLLYGENPIYKNGNKIDITNKKIEKVYYDDNIFFVYDMMLTEDGLDGLYLRGILSAEEAYEQINSVLKLSLLIFPLFMILAVLGGYIIAWRSLLPIKKIQQASEEIQEGSDLNKRIDIGKGDDELRKLAKTFNIMLDKLQKSFESERQFTSDASHELRTPISVIVSQCEYSLEKTREPSEYIEDIQLIQRQAKKMTKLVNSMLDLTRLQQNSNELIMEKLNYSELINLICYDTSILFKKNLTWHVKENIYITGNYNLLTSLVTNLVDNACKYSKDNGNIDVTLTSTKDSIILSVADDGIGMSEEAISNIWNRFYQVDMSRHGKGNGLGLSIVKEVAQIHGGLLTV